MATKKKAVARKDDETALVNESDYFTAKYDGMKIRGIVVNHGCESNPDFELYNAQSGNDNGCDEDYPYCIPLGEGARGTEQDLFNVGITNYVVARDKRQKAIIDKDALPEFAGEWRVKVEGDTFTFGCGAVELTRKEIEGFMRFRSKHDTEGMQELAAERLEYVELDDLKRYIAYEEALKTADGKLYGKVVDMAGEQDVDEEQMLLYSDSEIKELFKYADHLNTKA